jgi:hypothetical protein
VNGEHRASLIRANLDASNNLEASSCKNRPQERTIQGIRRGFGVSNDHKNLKNAGFRRLFAILCPLLLITPNVWLLWKILHRWAWKYPKPYPKSWNYRTDMVGAGGSVWGHDDFWASFNTNVDEYGG